MKKIIFFLLVSFITCSCVKRNKLYKEKDPEDLKISQYLYPFHNESQSFSTEITIRTKTTIPNHANISIPYLKYNKSWLFTLTQDDCKHAAYCYTWAAINGRPISKNYYYNRAYITAAQRYSPIQIMTAQAQTVKLYPSRVENDLQGQVINRMFSSIADTKKFIESQLSRDEKEREAICVGVHGTGTDWVEFLLWLNDQYGKDGNDSMWFTSLEEYYEYNYYRVHSTIQKIQIDAHTLKIKIDIPTGAYFYYPSITLNLEGISQTDITSITTDNTITGLSWADYKEGLMINIDCRKYLLEHATHFIEEYEKNPTSTNKRDALYFVNMLKDSPQKKSLLARIE